MAELPNFPMLTPGLPLTTSTLSISLTPTPDGMMRKLDATGPGYDLTVWAGVLRELSEELASKAAATDAAEAGTVVVADSAEA